MRRVHTIFLAAGLLILLTLTAAGVDKNAVNVTLDGVPLETVAAYTENGTTMVSLRALAEALGLTVTWDAGTRTAVLTSPGREPQLPERPLEALVVLDPGHGGESVGASYGGLYEKDLALSISLKTRELLEEAGAQVVMTRETDRDVGLYDRAELANRLGADLFVSVHCNASTTNPEAMGIYTAAYREGTGGWVLAETLRRTMMAETGAGDMGTEARPNLAVLNTSQMPAALVECGYMSTPEELALLADPDYQTRLAEGIAGGVLAYLEQRGG